MAGGRAISHVRGKAARSAGRTMAVGISRTECAYLCEVPRKPGVWFFSLDAGNALAVAIARAWFHLPYFRARMSCDGRDGYIYHRSGRTHRRAPSAVITCRYRPSNEVVYR